MFKCDVAIVGGGPAGTTVGCLLKKYKPGLEVVIVEREQFPRDHVGESHLPAISQILAEMGVWDKVEAAGFPIKIGATFKWGAKDELWYTDFLDRAEFITESRPAKFAGQRTRTAFQVDRSIYDKVLLDHARSMGCQVFEQTRVSKVEHEGDRVLGLDLVGRIPLPGDRLEARYYVDASGEGGVLRRALDVEVETPTTLKNIAIWKYWQNAEWAVSIGNGGTRIQIMSLGWGWLWFIPVTPTRTSIGLVLPASYYKSTGKTTQDLYDEAVAAEPLISRLVANARPEPELSATKDWNFVSKRMVGDNWFLAGDSCGFADPILSAGMTLAHAGARKVAYTILELDRGELGACWLKNEFERGHSHQIRHHMQFAEFWYSSNKGFTDLQEHCAEIAESAGLTLSAPAAFQWLATGGFAVQEPGVAAALTYRLGGLKFVAEQVAGEQIAWEVTKTNFWRLNLDGAVEDRFPSYRDGRITAIPCLRKGARLLPIVDSYRHLLNALGRNVDSIMILEDFVNAMICEDGIAPKDAPLLALETIESMLLEGWIKGRAIASRPFIKVTE